MINKAQVFLNKILLLSCVIFCLPMIAGANETLDTLLKKVLEEREYNSKEFKQRETLFKTDRDKRQSLLIQAQKELKREENIITQLTSQFEANEKDLAILQEELTLALGVLGELFGVVKQVSGDFRGQALNSIVSAEIPHRHHFAAKLAKSKKHPTTKELRQLWFALQQEMTEQGKVSQFSADVIAVDGSKSRQEVIRVGAFNLTSQGQYLDLQTEGDRTHIVSLARQPDRQWTSRIADLEKAKPEGVAIFALDPSQGQLISILLEIPTLLQKVRQGGYVGLVIIIVLLIGLSLAIERWFVISQESKKIKAQMQNESTPTSDNPLGQILLVYQKHKDLGLEALELKLSEVVIKYVPKVERRIGFIKILSAVAPLLGLLGTVTGMILTFQSITLFGTGDPKLMAGGISQALVTTVLGLVCAIPLLLLYSVIFSKARYLTQILEEQTAGLLAKKMLPKEFPPDRGINPTGG